MKTILLVDDEELFLSSLSEGLTKIFPQVKFETASNGEEAIKILDNQEVILLVTDLNMPTVSGLELVYYVLDNNPNINLIVMTAFGSSEIEELVHSYGSIVYLEKPIDFQNLTEHVQAIIAPTAKGHIKGIDLPNLLQLLYLERKTCTLTVSSQSRKGFMYFIDGELIDAEFASAKAEEAAYEILKLAKPEIEIESFSNKRIKKIPLNLEQILLEAAKRQDEYRKDTSSYKRNTGNFRIVSIDTLTDNQINDNEDSGILLNSDNNIVYESLENSTEIIDIYKQSDLLELDHIESIESIENIDQIEDKNILEIDSILSIEQYQREHNYLNNNNLPTNNSQNFLSNIINEWKKNTSNFVEKTALAFVKCLSQKEVIVLQGTDNLDGLSSEISNILDIVLHVSGNSPKGSFEYINNLFALTIAWDLEKKTLIVMTDSISSNFTIITFRRYRSILERIFLLS